MGRMGLRVRKRKGFRREKRKNKKEGRKIRGKGPTSTYLGRVGDMEGREGGTTCLGTTLPEHAMGRGTQIRCPINNYT